MATDSYIPKLSAESSTTVSRAQTAATWNTSRSRTVDVFNFVADTTTCALVMFACLLTHSIFVGTSQYLFHQMLTFSIAAGLCASIFLWRDVTHISWNDAHPVHATASTVRITFLALLLLLPGTFLLRQDFPRVAAAFALLLMPVALTLQRHLFTSLSKRHHRQSVLLAIAHSCDLPAQIDNRILFTQEVDVRIIHPPFERQEQTTQESDHETDGWLLFSRKTATTPQFYLYGKRILDLGISSICLVLFLPVFLVIAVTVRVSSNGPALFIQKRVGLGGTPFRMYKFRSMICSAEKYEHSPVSPDDPRITRVGRFLRRTSLDELPQLLNVFLGHMSLVGPRPEMPYIVSGYNNHQRMRLQVIPGITGLWQLSKDRAYPIHEHLHHDLSYISQRSLPLDIAILIHTLLFAMHGGI